MRAFAFDRRAFVSISAHATLNLGRSRVQRAHALGNALRVREPFGLLPLLLRDNARYLHFADGATGRVPLDLPTVPRIVGARLGHVLFNLGALGLDLRREYAGECTVHSMSERN